MSNRVESQEICEDLDSLNDNITATITKVASGLGMKNSVGVNKKRRNKIWFDGECVKVRKLVDSALKIYKQSNYADYARLFYLEMKNNYKNILRLKKKAFQTNSIQALENTRNSTEFWSTINRFRFKGFYHDVIDIDSWHRYLVDMYSPENDNFFTFENISDPILDCPITIDEIIESINKCKDGKASGTDKINYSFYKRLPENWIIYLQFLFNVVMSSERMPDSWGLLLMSMIFKKGDIGDPSNYRPITLVNCIVKIYFPNRSLVSDQKEDAQIIFSR